MWLSIKHFQISKNKLGLLNGFSYKIIFLLEYTGLLKLVCSHRAEQNLCESDNVFRRKDHFLETNKIRTVKGFI